MKLSSNLSVIERGARTLIGAGGTALVYLAADRDWGIVFPILWASGLTGICPIYRLLGLSFAPKEPVETSGIAAPGRLAHQGA